MKKHIAIWLLLLGAPLATQAQVQPKIEKVSFDEFEARLKKAGKQAQILDARLPEEYQQNHLPDAISFSIENKEQLLAQSAKLDKNRPVFIYSIGAGRSTVLAGQLKELGFADVTVVPGGLSKWIGLGRPVISTVGEGLSKEAFLNKVGEDELVLVDFGSRYCPGCKKLEPVVDAVEKAHTGNLKVVRIEAYENKNLVKELGVVSLPTLVLYRKSKEVWKKTGASTGQEIESALAENTL